MNLLAVNHLQWPLGRTLGPIGVDLGARSIKAVQVKRTRLGPVVASMASMPMLDRNTPTPDSMRATARQLRDVLNRQDFHGRQIVIAAPPWRVEADLLELPPRSSGAPIDALARAELGRAASLANEPFELASWDLPACGRGGSATAVMAVALRNADGEALLDAFEDAGLNISAIDIAPWACARACSVARSADGTTGIVDLGWDAARLTLLAQDAVVYQRILSEVGTRSLHQRIATSLDVEEDVVQYVLSVAGIAPQLDGAGSQAPDSINPGEIARVRSLIVHHADAIVSELKTSFAFASHRYPDLPVNRVVLSGGGAMVGGLAAAIGARLRIETAIWRPSMSAKCEGAFADRAGDPSLMVAMGLALYEGELV